jgi:hypothetical protein
MMYWAPWADDGQEGTLEGIECTRESGHSKGERKMRGRTCAPLALAAVVIMCATHADAHSSRTERNWGRVATELRERDDPYSLAAAALLSVQESRNQAVTLLDRAAASAPGHVELVWLQARFCLSAPACNLQPLERLLLRLDPHNGAAWLLALRRASSQHDERAEHAALAALSRSRRVDVYWTRLVARLTPAVARTGAISPGEAEVEVIGLLAAYMPIYAPVANACMGEPLQNPETIQVCRGVASALEQGDTYLTQMVGIAIAERVWPKRSAQWQAASAARRVFDYRTRLSAKREQRWVTGPGAEEFLRLCSERRREQEVSRDLLIQAGVQPDPPG